MSLANTAAEQKLVSYMLSMPESAEEIISQVMADDIHNADCKRVFRAIAGVLEAGGTIDLSAVVDRLKSASIDEKQATEICSDILLSADISDSVESLVTAVRRGTLRREATRALQSMQVACDTATAGELAEMSERLLELCESYRDGSGLIYKVSDNIDRICNWATMAHDTGCRTGCDSLDGTLRFAKGLLTVVTGIPSSGKSEFMDQLVAWLTTKHRWKWILFSPENFPTEQHAIKIAEKLAKASAREMPREKLAGVLTKMSEYVSWVDIAEHDLSLNALIDTLDKNFSEIRPDAIVIDPWNELAQVLKKGQTETDYIGECLMRIRRWARKRNVAVFVVAHPTKMHKDKSGEYEIPTPYSISGSANWYNKADNAITVHRKQNSRFVQVHVQKVKQKIHGQKGLVDLVYDNKTGVYYERTNCPHDVLHEAESVERVNDFCAPTSSAGEWS